MRLPKFSNNKCVNLLHSFRNSLQLIKARLFILYIHHIYDFRHVIKF